MVNASLMIIKPKAIIAWFMLPTSTLLLYSTNSPQAANREVFIKPGMAMTNAPARGVAGRIFAGFSVYLAYTSMPFFLTYLQDLHAPPLLAISIFGIVSSEGASVLPYPPALLPIAI